MFDFGITSDLFQRAIGIITNQWAPEHYPTERQYQNDLINVLRKQFNENQNQFLQPKRVSIQKEDSRSLCDIGIERKVGIELKKDFKGQSNIDRLVGQIGRHKKEYPSGVIIVLVGNTDKETVEQLKDLLGESNRNNYGLYAQSRVEIIDKSSTSQNSKKPKSAFSIWS